MHERVTLKKGFPDLTSFHTYLLKTIMAGPGGERRGAGGRAGRPEGRLPAAAAGWPPRRGCRRCCQVEKSDRADLWLID